MSKNTIIKKMRELLDDVSNLNDETIDESNWRSFYETAANELNLADGENNGEMDVYLFTYNNLGIYAFLRSKLKKALEKEGLNQEQRTAFYKAHLC